MEVRSTSHRIITIVSQSPSAVWPHITLMLLHDIAEHLPPGRHRPEDLKPVAVAVVVPVICAVIGLVVIGAEADYRSGANNAREQGRLGRAGLW